MEASAEELGAARLLPNRVAPRQRLRSKLLRVMLSIVVPLSLAMLAGVALMQYRASQRAAKDVEQLTREGIRARGRVLTSNHALALAGLVSDNAFGDVSQLVERAVKEDPDVVYGLFLSSDGKPWAYVTPRLPEGAHTAAELARWNELDLPASQLHPAAEKERSLRVFEQPILEFSAPVRDGEELLGTVRYGLATARMSKSLALARERASEALTTTLLVLAGLGLLNVLLGVYLIDRASGRITEPLAALTDTANAIAEGRRDVRATVTSNDELALLGAAFNQMLSVNQRAFEQLQETTERALEASRLKSEFLANMSHEIRTPMNGVMGMIKLMLQLPLDGKLRRYAETIDASANALLTIINDVLDFSKMEAGKYVVSPAPFEPRVVLQEVAELLSTRAYDKGLELVYRVAPEVPALVVGDQDRVRQILTNLIGNAVKFTERGEVFVELSLAEEGTQGVLLRCEVTDTGIGIAERELTGIFDAFSQVDGSLVRRHGGTGLGLAISKRLTEMMGGQIGVWSRPGVGSQFWFTLRLERAEPEAHTERRFGLPIGKRALVIEANHRWCDLIRDHLKAWGMECECFASGEQALARTSENARYDVAVIGAQTGQLGVRDVVAALRQRNAGRPLPLILLHQLGQIAPLTELHTEIAAQLAKPLRMSDLYDALQGAFAGRRKQHETLLRASAPLRHHEQKVLVVDDNEINRFVAVEALAQLGFDSDTARHGDEAVEMSAHNDYALILMDCQMPTKDGYAATREIRARERETGKHQIIVALTAHAMAGERERVLSAGMDDYLSKPLRANALERMLARHVRADDDVLGPLRFSLTPPGGQPKAVLPEGPSSSASANDPGTPAPSVAAPTQEPMRRSAASLPSAEIEQVGTQVGRVLADDVARSPVLIEMCLREMPSQLTAVGEALSRMDFVELRAGAHKLKGSAMAIAADALAEVAETLQRQAEHKQLEDAYFLVESLHSQFILVEAALQAELDARASA